MRFLKVSKNKRSDKVMSVLVMIFNWIFDFKRSQVEVNRKTICNKKNKKTDTLFC